MPENLDALTSEQLETMMQTGDYSVPAEETSPEPEAAPQAGGVPADVVEEVPAPEPEEIDYKALAEKLQSDLAEQKKHAARLAGEIGYLKNKGEPTGEAAGDRGDEEYSYDTTQNDLEDLRHGREEDRKRIERLESEYDVQTFARVVQAETSKVEQMLGGLRPEDMDVATEAAAQHAELIADLKREHNAELLHEGLRFVTQSIGNSVLAARNQRMQVQRVAASHANHRAKIAAAPSASGSTPPPPERPKQIADLTAAEADQWLRENVR